MARHLGPKAKLSRREGTDLFLKSARRSIGDKAKFDSKPGQHGRTSGSRTSDYGIQLREKQKVRRIYGVLERQFSGYYKEAASRKGATGENLLQLLECRLDNVVYRLGFADSRKQARQLVRHGHFVVNGRKTNVPSFVVSAGDEISVREGSRARTYFKDLDASGILRKRAIPEWLSLDPATLSARVLRLPERSELDLSINENLIVEFYSR